MFTVHDLRRTGSTILNEMGFNRDWIEKVRAECQQPNASDRQPCGSDVLRSKVSE